jgi:hypothetical protein
MNHVFWLTAPAKLALILGLHSNKRWEPWRSPDGRHRLMMSACPLGFEPPRSQYQVVLTINKPGILPPGLFNFNSNKRFPNVRAGHRIVAIVTRQRKASSINSIQIPTCSCIGLISPIVKNKPRIPILWAFSHCVRLTDMGGEIVVSKSRNLTSRTRQNHPKPNAFKF